MSSPPPSKEALVIVFDIGKSMSTRSVQAFEDAKKAVGLLVKAKIRTSPKDEIGFVVFGGRETKNHLNDTYEDEYKNISIVEPISTVSLNLYRTIESLQCTGGMPNVDFMDALIVAIDMIHLRCGTKKYNKRIFLVTDASYAGWDVKIKESIMSAVQKKNISITVIGVDFTTVGEDVKAKTPKQKNEQLLQALCQASGGVVVKTEQAIEALSEFRSKKVLQRTSFRGVLEIGTHFKIPVWAYKKTDDTKLPTAKKKSKLSKAEASEHNVIKQTTFFSIDEPDEEVPEEKRVKAYRYGKNYVPFNPVDEAKLKYQCPKCLQVIGFTAKSNILRQSYMDDAACFVPQPDDPDAAKAFHALVQALSEMERVIIVRYVYREGGEPKLGFLEPCIKADYVCFYFNVLPFTEDLRQYPFKSFSRMNLTERQEQAAEDLINAMDMTNVEKDEEGDPVESLKPSATYHPLVQYFYDCVHQRALNPANPIPEIDPLIIKYCFPEKSETSFYAIMMKKCQSALQEFSKHFTLSKVEKKTEGKRGQKRKYWFATTNESGELSLESYEVSSSNAASTTIRTEKEEENEEEYVQVGEGQQVKRLKGNPEEDEYDEIRNQVNQKVGIDSFFGDKASAVGTTNPVKDFKQMFSRKDADLVDKAISEMQSVILKLLQESIGSQYYSKALDCLIALREGCVNEEESEHFNNFLRKLKSLYGTPNAKRKEFWEMVKQKKVSLIHSDEAADSEISPQDAQKFLSEDTVEETYEEEEAPMETGEDDLFGDLE